MEILEDESVSARMLLQSLTRGCLVNQCRRTFSTRTVEAVLTMMYSFARCSLEFNGIPLLVDGADCVDTEPPPVIVRRSCNEERSPCVIPGLLERRSYRMPLGDSPDVATANAWVAAAELMRRRDDREEVTTTPGRTFFSEPSAAFRMLCRGDESTSLSRLAGKEHETSSTRD